MDTVQFRTADQQTIRMSSGDCKTVAKMLKPDRWEVKRKSVAIHLWEQVGNDSLVQA